jgi:hypothetical protein
VDKAYKVWWVERPEILVQLGLDDFIEHEGKPQFLLIDDIQYLNASCVKRLRSHLKQYPFLVLVVAGRDLPRELKLGATHRFTPNEASDRITILDKIAEVFPAWATTASQLQAESLREARLVRILLVLARGQRPIPKTLEELEEVFLRILVDDLEKIREQFPGLATAIMDATIFRQVGMAGLSRSVLIALANDHQPCAGIPILFEQVTDNSRWDVVTPLLSCDQSQNYFRFHHDELAEGLIQASKARLVEPYIDDAYRQVILDRFIRLATAPQGNVAVDRLIAQTASWLLQYFVCKRYLVNQTTAFSYIHQLLNAGINHHAYLSLIVNDALNLEQQESLNLLLTAAKVAPNNQSLWNLVWSWVNTSYPKQQEEILQQLYQAGCRSAPILRGWLQVLPREKAKSLAKEWIQNANQEDQVLCRCLELLGQEAKEEARKLLTTPGQNPHVLCRCLELLGQEAKEEARKLLTTPEQNPHVICRCLDLLGSEAKEKARVLLTTPGQAHEVLCRCLDLLGQEAKPEARVLLSTPGQKKVVLFRCLDLLGPEGKEKAHELLKKPRQNPQVICRCLELLGQEAKEEARQLLTTPRQNPQVICRCLELLGQEAKEEARQLLTTPMQYKEVLCRCLDVLGQEAKEEARVLLSTPGQAFEVLCRCLKLLGQEAKEEARLLLTTPGQYPQVFCLCITVASDTLEAQKAAEEILLRWQAGEKLNSAHKIVALQAPFDTELRKKMALQVFRNWHKEYRPVLTSALTAFWNDPDAVTDYCRQILKRWYKEIEYQHHKRNIQRHDGHIIKALAHPSLRRQAGVAATQMLQAEANSPGFLTPLLHQQVLEIAQGQFPSWTGKEEETEPLQTPQMGMLRPPKVPEVLSQSVSSPQILSSKPKRIKNPQPPKLPSQSVKKSESRNLDSWQEKLDKLKEFYPDE